MLNYIFRKVSRVGRDPWRCYFKLCIYYFWIIYTIEILIAVYLCYIEDNILLNFGDVCGIINDLERFSPTSRIFILPTAYTAVYINKIEQVSR